MSLLVKNGYVMTLDDANSVVRKGAIYIENDKIVEVGPTTELEKKYTGVDKTIDANGRVVMPGMICGHMHFYSAFATGMPLDPFPPGFVSVLENLWWKIDKALLKEDVYYSAMLGYLQAIKSGTTTVIDHHASPSFVGGSLDVIEDVARKVGVRSNLCYEITNRNSDEEAEEGLEENRRFVEKCQRRPDDLVSGLVGIHASFTVSEEIMAKVGEVVANLDTGVHIHVAEGKADMEHARKEFNSTVVERLGRHKLLNPKSILAHCIHIEDVDYALLKESQANIVTQPRSNMNNAVGALDIWKLQEHGIPFGLGTDGMSSDMRAELIVGNLIHKHIRQDNTVGTMEMYNALFQQNPEIVRRVAGVETGALSPGKKADILVTNYYPKSPINPNNVVGHVLFGTVHEPISTTIVDGRVLMENSHLLVVDEAEVAEKCYDLAQQVWARVN